MLHLSEIPMTSEHSKGRHTTFAGVVTDKDEVVDLAYAALLIARAEYPTLDVDSYLDRLKEMGSAIQSRVKTLEDPLQVVQAINNHLYRALGFEGNETDYYDPRNSFLNDVLDRKRGIPITLSIIYMEMGRLIGFPLSGVGFPQHFLVKHRTPNQEILIDPFNKGIVLTPDDLANRLRITSGGELEFRDHFLASSSKKQILKRVLTNLKAIYLSRSDHTKVLSIINMLLDIAPWDMDELRDRGQVHYHLKEYKRALEDLETYLRFNQQAPDVQQITRNVSLLKKLI